MSASPIPRTAPFAEEEIELLNRVVGPASATQRAWLAGFLAGLEVTGEVSDTAPAPAPAPEARPAGPLTILSATESRNAEKLAPYLATVPRKNGLRPTLPTMAA